MEKTKTNALYGGVTFGQFEAAAITLTEYLNGLVGTYAIRDLIKDEHKENLKHDIVLAAILDISISKAQKRFHDMVIELSEGIKKEQEAKEIDAQIAAAKAQNHAHPIDPEDNTEATEENL